MNNELDEIIEHAYNAGYSVKGIVIAKIQKLLLQERIDTLQRLEHVDWESYYGRKKDYDDGTNQLIDMYVEAYVTDETKELQNQIKEME